MYPVSSFEIETEIPKLKKNGKATGSYIVYRSVL
jgi:hypothetical protein